jgi:hypothetical protein
MEYRVLFLITTLWFASGNAFSQMQMGIAHDNMNVTENIRINPALSVDPIPWMDIKITGVYGIAVNNSVYMHKDSFNLFRKEYPDELSQNMSRTKVGGQVEGTVYGPAASISFGKFSVGLNMAFRNYVIGRNLTKEITQAIVEGPRLPEYYNVPLEGSNYRLKGMSFTEFGLNGGYMIYEMGGNALNIGATVKYLVGVSSANMLVDNFAYEMFDTTNAVISNFSGRYGGTDPEFFSGTGFGLDLGITYEEKVNRTSFTPHSPGSKCRYTEYLYRVGFSILDIGSIKFNNSPYREVENASGPWIDYNTSSAQSIEEGIAEADQLLSNGITVRENTYKARLPLSFSFQFDYNVGQGLYVNAFLLYGAGLKNSFGAERLSMISITPRYEDNRIGIAAPLSINQLGRAGLGLSFRIWYLSFGTDNIIPILFNTNVYRLDAYAQLKIPILKSQQCKRKGLGETNWRFKDCSGPGAPSPRGKQKRDY